MRVAYRHKRIAGETHLLKHTAGVAAVGNGGGISFGQYELCRRQHKLYLTLHTDYREYAQRNVYALGADTFLETTAEPLTYHFGNAIAGDTAMSERTAFFNQFRIQAYGMRNFHNYRGKRAFGITAQTLGTGAEIVVGRVGLEHRNVLLTAEKNYFLIISGNAFYFNGSAVAYADFQFNAEIVSHCHVEKSAVKGYFLNGNARRYNVHAFGSYCCCVIYNILRGIGKLNFKVFKTVFVPRGIEYSVNTDADLFAGSYTGIVSFYHIIFILPENFNICYHIMPCIKIGYGYLKNLSVRVAFPHTARFANNAHGFLSIFLHKARVFRGVYSLFIDTKENV